MQSPDGKRPKLHTTLKYNPKESNRLVLRPTISRQTRVSVANTLNVQRSRSWQCSSMSEYWILLEVSPTAHWSPKVFWQFLHPLRKMEAFPGNLCNRQPTTSICRRCAPNLNSSPVNRKSEIGPRLLFKLYALIIKSSIFAEFLIHCAADGGLSCMHKILSEWPIQEIHESLEEFTHWSRQSTWKTSGMKWISGDTGACIENEKRTRFGYECHSLPCCRGGRARWAGV